MPYRTRSSGVPELLLVLEVVGDDRLAGMQGVARRRFEIGANGGLADHAPSQAHAGTDQQAVVGRNIFEDLAELCFQPVGGEPRGLLEQLHEARALQGEHAELRQDLLLANALIRRTPILGRRRTFARRIFDNGRILAFGKLHRLRPLPLLFVGTAGTLERSRNNTVRALSVIPCRMTERKDLRSSATHRRSRQCNDSRSVRLPPSQLPPWCPVRLCSAGWPDRILELSGWLGQARP